MNIVPDGYRMALIPCDPGSDPSPEAIDWMQAASQGFNQSRPTPEQLATRWQVNAHDDPRVLGLYATKQPVAVANDWPVATFASFDGTVNTGTGLATSNFITEVTVRNGHRRKGLLRALMTADLTEAHKRGVAFASLTVSEGSIYQRFGFGVSAQEMGLRITNPLQLGWYAPTTHTTDLITPDQSVAIHDQIFEAWHRQSMGSHSRATWWRKHLSAQLNDEGKPNRELYTAVAAAADGSPEGLITYSFGTWDEHELRVIELLALTEAAEIALWRHVCSQDLINTVTAKRVPVDSPIGWATTDARAVTVDEVRDSVWLRVLDVPAALGQRAWVGAGEVTVEVHDVLGFAAGRWRLEVNAGQASLEPTSTPAEISMSADALASLYTGAVSVRTMAAVGRVHGDPGAIEVADALFATAKPPRNSSFF